MTAHRLGDLTVIEMNTPALMDPRIIDAISQALNRLVEEENCRQIVLDLERVQFVSSQALGLIITLHRKLNGLRHSSLVLCGLSPRFVELLSITRLDRLLTIRQSQREAVEAV
jgi:anti-sigma B factor antagonist